MPKPEREVQVLANKAAARVELVCLQDGAKVYDINWTVEQAVNHVKAIVAAVDLIQGKKSGLILNH